MSTIVVRVDDRRRWNMSVICMGVTVVGFEIRYVFDEGVFLLRMKRQNHLVDRCHLLLQLVELIACQLCVVDIGQGLRNA